MRIPSVCHILSLTSHLCLQMERIVYTSDQIKRHIYYSSYKRFYTTFFFWNCEIDRSALNMNAVLYCLAPYHLYKDVNISSFISIFDRISLLYIWTLSQFHSRCAYYPFFVWIWVILRVILNEIRLFTVCCSVCCVNSFTMCYALNEIQFHSSHSFFIRFYLYVCVFLLSFHDISFF